jgi:multidrug efflux pump subunit AcrA (membrane-fusion protein)
LIGREVEIAWRLGPERRTFDARIARTGAEIDPAVGGIEVFAVLGADAHDDGLRAGAFVEVRVPDVEYRDVFELPAAAVSDDGRAYVLEEGRLREIAVEVRREVGERVLVDAPLADGALVVARHFAGIGPGLRARAP